MSADLCAKCGAPLEFGILADATHSATALARGPERVLEWLRGEPGGSWLGGFSVAKGDRLQVATLRCTQCGYLELYAPQRAPRICRCGYALTGLDVSAPCPECGSRA